MVRIMSDTAARLYQCELTAKSTDSEFKHCHMYIRTQLPISFICPPMYTCFMFCTTLSDRSIITFTAHGCTKMFSPANWLSNFS